jgi:hypothetical protein
VGLDKAEGLDRRAEEEAGRDWERDERVRDRRENLASRSSVTAFVVWSAVFRDAWRLSTWSMMYICQLNKMKGGK